MKERILKLCKHLNKFSQADIETISGLRPYELMPILYELQTENIIDEVNGVYYFVKINKTPKLELPQLFQLYSKEQISCIIKSFCADIEAQKIMLVLDFTKHSASKFYQYFRTVLYEKQKDELLKYFETEQKIGQERIYMNTKVYLYLYNHKLYVSDVLLKSVNACKHTNDERLEIKKIYLRSFRKVLNRSFERLFHLHLAEEIWKYEKSFETRYEFLNQMLFS